MTCIWIIWSWWLLPSLFLNFYTTIGISWWNVVWTLVYIDTALNQQQPLLSGGWQSQPSKHESLARCWADVGPSSTTLAQHQPHIGLTTRVCWGALPVISGHRKRTSWTCWWYCNLCPTTQPASFVSLWERRLTGLPSVEPLVIWCLIMSDNIWAHCQTNNDSLILCAWLGSWIRCSFNTRCLSFTVLISMPFAHRPVQL